MKFALPVKLGVQFTSLATYTYWPAGSTTITEGSPFVAGGLLILAACPLFRLKLNVWTTFDP